MRNSFMLFFYFLLFNEINAQTVLSGKVKDNKGRPVPGASITLKDTYDGATSDSSGIFSFKTTEHGEHILSVTNVGFNQVDQKIVIGKSPLNMVISLKEKLDELKAVTVTAGSFEAGDRKKAATVLSSLDVVTVGGGNADITSAVKTLPGAQQIGEKEGLFVRGGTGAETKQFIDGTLVNNPYYSSVPDIGSRGRFSPFLFKGTVFSTGGYSALYGQALSSALILESIDLPQHSEIDVSISPLLIGAGMQQLAKNKKSSWGVNYGYLNLKAYFSALKQAPDYFNIPQFHNADGNFRIKTKNGIIKYYTTFSYSSLGLRRPDVDSLNIKDAFGLNNYNWYNNLSWRETLGKGWKMNLGAGYSTNKDNINQQLQNQTNSPQTFPEKPWLENKNFMLASRQDLSQLRAVFEKKLPGISAVRFGSEYWYSFNNSRYNRYDTLLKDHYQAVFAETDIHLTNDFAAQIGGRFEYSSVIKKVNAAPRISFAYKTGTGAQVSLAYGIFYQKPENMYLMTSPGLCYTKAVHYILNYQKTTEGRIFRVEAYYKKYQDLVKTFPLYNNDGKGYAKGLEFFWRDKKTIKNLDYWISYSYLNTKRDYLNYPSQLQPNFAADHTASVVIKRFYIKIKTGFNFTYSYAAGRPYYNFMLSNNKYEIADKGTTKDYHNLGFSMNYVPSLGKTNSKLFWVLVASVTNVLGSSQVYGYNYSYNGFYKQPITPPAKRFFFIGAFFSIGVDRTQDAINNNL
jgi:vitamin B12 transporter